MDVSLCLVSSGISLWSYSEIDKIGWDSVSLAVEEGSWRYNGPSWGGQPGEGCDPRSWHLCFWVQPVLLLDPCSSPAEHPEPGPGPVAQTCVLWRPRAHNSGCAAAAAHHWGDGYHLEAAPGPQSSYIQGRWPYVSKVSTLSEWSLGDWALNFFVGPGSKESC